MSGVTDYGNFGSDPNVQPSGGIVPSSSNDKSSTSPLSASSIQASELQALAFILMANTPTLSPPKESEGAGSVNVNLAGITALNAANKQHEIILDMWESYIKSIKEIAEKNEKEEIRDRIEETRKNGPKSSAEYSAFLMAISSTQRADEIAGSSANALTTNFTQTYNTWFVNPMDSGASNAVLGLSGAYPAASFMAGTVASYPDAIRHAIGADGAALGIQLSSSPVADALAGVGPTSGLPGDYQAAAALVAALLNGGAFNKALIETVSASEGGGKPQHDLNFATNYAKHIMAIVTKNIGPEDPTDPRAAQNNMIRLMLSVMALNLLYRVAYGGINSQEFQGLLAGETKDLNPEVKGILEQLAGLVNTFLPKNSGNTLARLTEYFDSDESRSIESMLETSRALTIVLSDRNDEMIGKRVNSTSA